MNQLSMSRKISYAMGGMALNLANLAISQWLLKLYVPSRTEALVSPLLFSTFFLVGRAVDGITEPIAGYVSDHFRSRRGRRLPFIMFFTLPAAAISFLLWIPPYPGEMHWLNALWVFVLIQLFFICWSLLANPYLALLPEITTDLKERVNISTLQALFIMIGTFIFAATGPLKDSVGWAGIGLLVGGVTVLSFIPTMLAIREKPSTERQVSSSEGSPASIFKWAGTTFRNRPFRYLLAATSLMWFSLNIVILIVPFWVQYSLGMGDRDVVLMMIPFLCTNILAFFLFNALSGKFGKYPVFIITLVGGAVTMPLFTLVGLIPGAGVLMQSQAVMALIGIPVAGIMILPPALLSDVIDHDETLTGRRREGIYVGVQAIFQKISIGLSIMASTALMYFGGTNLPTVTGLKLVSVCAGAGSLLALLVFSRYPIRERGGKAYLLDR
jgi:glycoside/pentoside/hexuronide:cation symporter, GPH family